VSSFIFLLSLESGSTQWYFAGITNHHSLSPFCSFETGNIFCPQSQPHFNTILDLNAHRSCHHLMQESCTHMFVKFNSSLLLNLSNFLVLNGHLFFCVNSWMITVNSISLCYWMVIFASTSTWVTTCPVNIWLFWSVFSKSVSSSKTNEPIVKLL
jgi:hypothetical protein